MFDIMVLHVVDEAHLWSFGSLILLEVLTPITNSNWLLVEFRNAEGVSNPLNLGCAYVNCSWQEGEEQQAWLMHQTQRMLGESSSIRAAQEGGPHGRKWAG